MYVVISAFLHRGPTIHPGSCDENGDEYDCGGGGDNDVHHHHHSDKGLLVSNCYQCLRLFPAFYCPTLTHSAANEICLQPTIEQSTLFSHHCVFC